MRSFFAAATLAFLLLAAIAEFVSAHKTGDIPKALTVRLKEERLLFGSWGKTARLRAGEPLFLASLALFLLERILWQSSQLYALTGHTALFRLLYPLLSLLLLAKFFLCTPLSLRQLGRASAVYIAVLFAMSGAYEYGFYAACAFLLAAKGCRARRVLRVFLGVTALSLLVLTALSLAGAVEIYSVYTRADAAPRLQFGFVHPNLAGVFAMALAMEAVLLFRGRRAPLGWALFVLLFAAVVVPIDSRSASVGLFVFGILMLLLRLFPRLLQKRPSALLAFLAPLLAAAVSLAGALAYVPESPRWFAVSEASSGRLALWHLAFTLFTPGLRAQTVLFGSPDMPGSLYALDNSYLYLLFSGGLVLFALALAALSALAWALARRGQGPLLAALLAWLAYGCFEQNLFYPWTNFLVLLLCPLVYGALAPPPAVPGSPALFFTEERL